MKKELKSHDRVIAIMYLLIAKDELMKKSIMYDGSEKDNIIHDIDCINRTIDYLDYS